MEKLAALLFFSALVGNTLEDDITASRAEVFSSEGRSVTLSCSYSVKADNLQWYRQDPGSAPQFLLLITDAKEPSVVEAKPPHPQLTANLNEERNRVDLQISSAAVTDSAVYYCAVNAGGVAKMTFGSGTRLTIEAKDEFEPSYYKLKDGNNTEACLATGFSRQNATKLDPKNEGLFNNSEAVLISEEPLDGLFNQVALLNSTSEGKCQETDGDGLCEETLELDPTVNGMTLTITILRLIFFKTVVFNIVMSLRLWISQ